MLLIEGLDDYVALEPVSHRYHDKGGLEYESVSKFIGRFKQPFNREMISRAVAKKRGISQEEVLGEWDAKRDGAIDHGNRIHDALERYEKSTTILLADMELSAMIKSVMSNYKDYYRCVAEAVLYDTENRLAGTTDKIMQKTSHKRSVIDFDDYKTNVQKGIEFESSYGNYMTGPLSHLQDCNYSHYSLQLSIYAYLFQKKTGRKIGRLSLMYIPYDNIMAYRRIPVPYMKYEVEAMLKWRKETDPTFGGLKELVKYDIPAAALVDNQEDF